MLMDILLLKFCAALLNSTQLCARTRHVCLYVPNLL